MPRHHSILKARPRTTEELIRKGIITRSEGAYSFDKRFIARLLGKAIDVDKLGRKKGLSISLQPELVLRHAAAKLLFNEESQTELSSRALETLGQLLAHAVSS